MGQIEVRAPFLCTTRSLQDIENLCGLTWIPRARSSRAPNNERLRNGTQLSGGQRKRKTKQTNALPSLSESWMQQCLPGPVPPCARKLKSEMVWPIDGKEALWNAHSDNVAAGTGWVEQSCSSPPQLTTAIHWSTITMTWPKDPSQPFLRITQFATKSTRASPPSSLGHLS